MHQFLIPKYPFSNAGYIFNFLKSNSVGPTEFYPNSDDLFLKRQTEQDSKSRFFPEFSETASLKVSAWAREPVWIFFFFSVKILLAQFWGTFYLKLRQCKSECFFINKWFIHQKKQVTL